MKEIIRGKGMSRREFIKELISHQHCEGLATATLRVNPTVNRLVACGKKQSGLLVKPPVHQDCNILGTVFGWNRTGTTVTNRTGPVPTVFFLTLPTLEVYRRCLWIPSACHQDGAGDLLE
jgi:hypothetical protein